MQWWGYDGCNGGDVIVKMVAANSTLLLYIVLQQHNTMGRMSTTYAMGYLWRNSEWEGRHCANGHTQEHCVPDLHDLWIQHVGVILPQLSHVAESDRQANTINISPQP